MSEDEAKRLYHPRMDLSKEFFGKYAPSGYLWYTLTRELDYYGTYRTGHRNGWPRLY